MNFKKTLKSIKDYFNLAPEPAAPPAFKYEVKPASKGGFGKRLKDYFDLASQYKKGDALATAIMQLANAEGVTGGHFDSSTMTGRYGFTYTEGDFKIALQPSGHVLLNCTEEFAGKVKALDSVAAVDFYFPPKPLPPSAYRYGAF